jgi:hypothetical protein
VAADMLNDRVLPFFEEQDISLLRILTDRGTEYCGQRGHHEYQLYLAVENIDHSRTKTKRPQTNGNCEHFHKPSRMSSTAWRFARSSTLRSISYRPTWIVGWKSTMSMGRTRANTALGKHRCKRFSILATWRMKKNLIAWLS